MQILIILLMLLLFSVLLPILLPILSIAAILVLGLNLLRMFRPDNYKRFDQSTRRKNIFERQEDPVPPEEVFRQEPDNAETVYERPASVRSDEFWEQNHTVYDVPYEDAAPVEPEEQSRDKE